VKIKLDENVHGDVKQALVSRGLDVLTAHDQALAGRPDADVAAAVKSERRCLVTFDLGFADTRRVSPRDFSGIVVLRLRIPTSSLQVRRLASFFGSEAELEGHLWIVDEVRARDWTP
jgi:predicted nuclease of predicted toxin-antitoxin system